MEQFTAIVKVISYFDDEQKTDYIAITHVSTFSEAMQKIEEYYGEDLISLSITLIEYPYLNISKDLYDSLLEKSI